MISATAAALGLLVAMVGCAAVSASAMIASVNEEDASSAWRWAAIFVGTSLVAAWCFVRLM
jgi:hypothetical protein